MDTRLLKAIPEKQFQRDVESLCTSLGLRYYHTWNSRNSPGGFPDLVIAGTRVIFAELKKETGTTTLKQRDWEMSLRAAHAEYHLWRPSDMPEIIKILKGLR